MAKRLSDTDKYKKKFFKGLPGAYKLFWDYLYHNCDNAGIWIKDFDIAQAYLGADMQVNEQDALKFFVGRLIVFDRGEKWFIPAFIEFQYECTIANLNPKNNAHLSVIKKLKKEGLIEGLLAGAQDIDKDKDKVMDKDKDKYITVENEKIFEVLPLLEYYEAALNGREQEHRLRNWRDVVPEWFEQSIQLDFKDQKHVFYAFSKYFINQGRAPTKVNGAVKLTPEEMKSL